VSQKVKLGLAIAGVVAVGFLVLNSILAPSNSSQNREAEEAAEELNRKLEELNQN
jgi:hypothetical protein